MYIDFEDHHPDTPHLPPAFSQLERLLLTVVAYLVIVIGYLVMPASWFAPREVVPLSQVPKDDVTFVMMEPLKDRVAPPKVRAEASDVDRQATTRERAPVPDNPAPFSRGNTPDKVEGAPVSEPPKGSNGAAPTTAPPVAPVVLPPVTTPAGTPGEGLKNSLRNLQKSLRNENFENENGGQTQQDAQISFDSKGVDFGWWLRRFVAQVKGNWFIPQAAMVLKGRVVITLMIHRNGTISDVTVIQTSGVQSLDNAAVNALKTSNPTVALPPEYPEEQVLFTVTFLYNLR
ncbi:MAG: TonB family protein [Vicinamibacterales bacterium]